VTAIPGRDRRRRYRAAVIGVAVVGAGHWGPNLVATLRDLARVTWIVETDPARADAVRRRFPAVNVTSSLDIALSDHATGAVVVATPTATHPAVVWAALAARCHVLCEKPLSYDLATATALAAEADERGLVLAVGHLFLYHPAVAWIRDYLAAGELGTVRYLSMVRTNLGPVRTDVNAAWDLASHDLSIANWWLDAVPTAVSATAASWVNHDADAVFATLEYPNRVRVQVHVSWVNPNKERRITVVGDGRMVTFDDMVVAEPVRVYDAGVERTPAAAGDTGAFRASVRTGDIHIPRIAPDAPLRAECEDFLSCVRTGATPRASAARALDVLATLEAIDRSCAADGAPVTVGDLAPC
jgi:predicted dehydrogenase